MIIVKTGCLSIIRLLRKPNIIVKLPRCSFTTHVSTKLLQSSITAIFSSQRNMGVLSPLDPSSYSRPELTILNHVSLKLNVNFENKSLNGSALLHFDILKEVDELILDVSNLNIQAIELEDGTPLQYDVNSLVENFGSKLTIKLPSINGPKTKVNVRVRYTTSPSASALQWLDPNQTSSKQHPYLFSQCQPIHARSILPCQDSPFVKFTYDAEVTAPEQFTVLMSALRNNDCESGHGLKKTCFKQPIPIPSYLLALAVGVLESRRLGPRSLVWSEEPEIERSAWEFADTEKFLQAAERLSGPYEWTQYDLLVLPPSFPYGGMENPCLTFVTPTLLAGDRSQANVIVHEIMHSWTGNLVTNRNFEHFWLNEGFTVFLERKADLHLIADPEEAKRTRDFHSLLGLQELSETINNHLGATNPLSRLVVNLTGVHPDDSFSRVPYEKGSLFLRYIEDMVGGPDVFDDFMRSYLTHFKKKSLDTDQFKSYLLDYFKDNKELHSLDWNAWLYSTGMPPAIPSYDTAMTKACSHLVAYVWRENASTLTHDDIKMFTPHQVIHFLQLLIDSDPLPLDKVQAIGDAYKLKESKNSEITYLYLRVRIASHDTMCLDSALEFVNSQGRMKYLRPIYRDLYSWEDVRKRAVDNFLKNEPYMMHVTAYTLRKDLHLD